ncbi:MAG: hypothetical protein Q7J56_00465 [Deltaproteobacteria bacterium]|nr:hypothetical protein [Deltaproteobacteria bacterium]
MSSFSRNRIGGRALVGFGIKPEKVKVMLKDNPVKLMWFDQK